MTYKILIVEDNQRHLNDALAYFSSKPVKIDTAENLSEARSKLPGVDAVITDIFFPSGEDLEGDSRLRKDLSKILEPHVDGDERRELRKWAEGETLAPFGVYVALDCEEQKKPRVMNTAGYHHGIKYEPVCQFSRENDWKIQDIPSNGRTNPDAPKKNWEGAYRLLVREIVEYNKFIGFLLSDEEEVKMGEERKKIREVAMTRFDIDPENPRL